VSAGSLSKRICGHASLLGKGLLDALLGLFKITSEGRRLGRQLGRRRRRCRELLRELSNISHIILYCIADDEAPLPCLCAPA
jgi:hypothetical protein